MKLIHILFLVSFFISVGIFFLHFDIVGNGVWGDGQYYYAYIRSAVIDGNLHMQDELDFFHRPFSLTETGFAANKYSIGPSILWAPFFIIAHIVSNYLRILGVNVVSNGYGYIYQWAIGIASILYGILGLWFCYLVTQKYTSKKVALFATLTIFLSTNLFFYIAIDPINSQPISFFLASLSIYLIFKKFNTTVLQYLLLGISTGLLTVNRNQDILVILPFVLLYVLPYRNRIISFLFGFIPIISLQTWVWYMLYGEITNPYLQGGEFFLWLTPRIYEVLFSPSYGLLYFAPILIMSLVGILLLYTKNKKISVAMLLSFCLELYLVASWHDWYGGASYGARMFISMMPYFIWGFAFFMHRMWGKRVIMPLAALLSIVVNFCYIIRFLYLSA